MFQHRSKYEGYLIITNLDNDVLRVIEFHEHGYRVIMSLKYSCSDELTQLCLQVKQVIDQLKSIEHLRMTRPGKDVLSRKGRKWAADLIERIKDLSPELLEEGNIFTPEVRGSHEHKPLADVSDHSSGSKQAPPD